MTERPIIMSDWSVRALLAGTKTQTRRVVKPQPQTDHLMVTPSGELVGIMPDDGTPVGSRPCQKRGWLKCPFGGVGDTLWVREAFSAWFHCCHWRECTAAGRSRASLSNLFYRATHNFPADDQKWSPAIHMPRWASRITLEITGVRCEPLHEITEEDIRAEGIEPVLQDSGGQDQTGRWVELVDYFHPFIDAWDKLNAKRGYSWASRPYVWAISFKRID